MQDAIFVGGGAPIDRTAKHLMLTVHNRGRVGCTVTHFFFVGYENWWKRLRKKSNFDALINTHGGQGHSPPYELRAGGVSFSGIALQTPEIEERSRTSRLYIGIYHTLADKPFLMRIKPSVDKPT